MRFGVLALACVGCGRVGFDSVVDAAFATPVALAELNSPVVDDDPSLTGDMLEIYFASHRSGTEQLYRATRNTVTEPWSAPAPVPELNTSDINNPKVSLDGLTLVFASSRTPNAGNNDIWIATRPDRYSAWSPRHLDELATVEDDFEPYLVASDALELFFGRSMGSDSDIWSATRSTTADAFGNAVPLVELDAPVYDGGTWVNAPRTLLMFHSTRSGASSDIYYSTRSRGAETWSAPLSFADFNTEANESDAWMSPDGRTFVFVSNRDGDDNLYIATR
ncbi:MAG TPA: hypothetical protein VIV11_14270 [Kofleriaceae bacterium]